MSNHPNRSKVRYFKVCPRGFANEVIYFRVREHEAAEVEAKFDGFENRTSGYCNWSDDKRASMPGVAVDWEDRAYVGY